MRVPTSPVPVPAGLGAGTAPRDPGRFHPGRPGNRLARDRVESGFGSPEGHAHAQGPHRCRPDGTFWRVGVGAGNRSGQPSSRHALPRSANNRHRDRGRLHARCRHGFLRRVHAQRRHGTGRDQKHLGGFNGGNAGRRPGEPHGQRRRCPEQVASSLRWSGADAITGPNPQCRAGAAEPGQPGRAAPTDRTRYRAFLPEGQPGPHAPTPRRHPPRRRGGHPDPHTLETAMPLLQPHLLAPAAVMAKR